MKPIVTVIMKTHCYARSHLLLCTWLDHYAFYAVSDTVLSCMRSTVGKEDQVFSG
jgi:hypothetical protein